MKAKLLVNTTISGVPCMAGDEVEVTPGTYEVLVRLGAVAAGQEVVPPVDAPTGVAEVSAEKETTSSMSKYFTGKKKG